MIERASERTLRNQKIVHRARRNTILMKRERMYVRRLNFDENKQ